MRNVDFHCSRCLPLVAGCKTAPKMLPFCIIRWATGQTNEHTSKYIFFSWNWLAALSYISPTVFCLFDRLTTIYSRAAHQESTGFILIDERKRCQTKPNLSGGNDDNRQRTVRPADLWLERLETLDHGDGVGQGLTCRDQSQSSAGQIRN